VENFKFSDIFISEKFLEICQFFIMEGYIFNQVITLLSKTSSKFLK